MYESTRLHIEEGWPIRRIAKELRMGRETIRVYLHRDGYKPQSDRKYEMPKKDKTPVIGTEYQRSDGRWVIRYPDGIRRRVLRYVWVMEQKLGGPIPDGYVVHHIDGDKTNDHPNNLELITQSEHASQHLKGKRYGRFTDAQIQEMVELYKTGEYSYKKISEIYGTSHQYIGRLIRREVM